MVCCVQPICEASGRLNPRPNEQLVVDNPAVFRDQVDRSKTPKTSSGKVTRTIERFSWYSSDDPMAKIEPPGCRQFKQGDFMANLPLNWNQIIDDDDDDDDWVDPRMPTGGMGLPASSPSSHSYPSTSLVPRSNLLCPQSSTFCVDPSSACDASSSSSASASSPSSPSYPSTSQVPRSNLSSSVTARRHQLAVGMTLLSSPSSSKSLRAPGIQKCSSSSVQLLSIGMSGSVLPISGSSSATSEVK